MQPVVNLATTLLLAALFHVMPVLTRPDLFFAVTVAPDFARSATARTIVRRYRAMVWLGTLASLALGLRALPWTTVASLPVQLLAALVAFLDARRHALPHAVAPSTLREASLAPRMPVLPGGWALQLGPFVLLAIAAARALAQRRAALGALVGSALVCALLAGFAVALAHTARPVAARGEAGQAEREFKRLALLVLVGAEYVNAGKALALVLLGPAPLVSLLALVGAALVLVLAAGLTRVGQGGSQRVAPAPEDGAPVGDRTRDEKWKWGLFYLDGDDPALLMEKRFGIGYTLNLGNPWAWVLVGLLLVVVLLPLVLPGLRR